MGLLGREPQNFCVLQNCLNKCVIFLSGPWQRGKFQLIMDVSFKWISWWLAKYFEWHAMNPVTKESSWRHVVSSKHVMVTWSISKDQDRFDCIGCTLYSRVMLCTFLNHPHQCIAWNGLSWTFLLNNLTAVSGTVKPVWNDHPNVKKRWSFQKGSVRMESNDTKFSAVAKWSLQRGWSFQRGSFETSFTVLWNLGIRVFKAWLWGF